MRTRSLLAAPAVATLLLGIVGGTALAQEETGPGTQACTDATQVAIEAKAEAEGLGLELGVTIAEIRRLEAHANAEAAAPKIAAVEAALAAESDRAAACAPPEETTEPSPTNEAPPADEDPDTDPPYETCAEAIEAGEIVPAVRGINDNYQPNLDSDGDGVACEANEGTGTPPTDNGGDTGSNDTSGGSGEFSQLDDVPSAAAETGGGPA